MPGLTLFTWISQTLAAGCVCAAARVAAIQSTTINRNSLRIGYDLLKIFLFDLGVSFYTLTTRTSVQNRTLLVKSSGHLEVANQ
jgi:hypothetical protein